MQFLKKRTRILLIILCIHAATCLTFILFTSFLKSTKISRFYKVYIMPGPFFSEASVKRSHHMLVAWKDGDQWTAPSNHALELFDHYQSTFNPVYLNENRLERALYENSIRKSARKRSREISLDKRLIRYVKENIVPAKSDSASLMIIRETSGKKDSVLFNQKFRLSHD